MNNQRHRRVVSSAQGGRRPGAGAPRGNINALKWGLSTGRFYGAPAVLMTLPRIRELWASLDLTNKDDVAYYKELLEAAALFLTWHEGPRQIEELTRAYLELRVDDFDRGRDLYHNLHHMVDDKSRPVRAMIYSFEVMQHIPALRDHIESRIVPWFWAAHAIVREQRRSQQETSPSPEPALSHAEGPALSQAEGSESGTGGEVQKTLENSIKQLQSNADDG